MDKDLKESTYESKSRPAQIDGVEDNQPTDAGARPSIAQDNPTPTIDLTAEDHIVETIDLTNEPEETALVPQWLPKDDPVLETAFNTTKEWKAAVGAALIEYASIERFHVEVIKKQYEWIEAAAKLFGVDAPEDLKLPGRIGSPREELVDGPDTQEPERSAEDLSQSRSSREKSNNGDERPASPTLSTDAPGELDANVPSPRRDTAGPNTSIVSQVMNSDDQVLGESTVIDLDEFGKDTNSLQQPVQMARPFRTDTSKGNTGPVELLPASPIQTSPVHPAIVSTDATLTFPARDQWSYNDTDNEGLLPLDWSQDTRISEPVPEACPRPTSAPLNGNSVSEAIEMHFQVPQMANSQPFAQSMHYNHARNVFHPAFAQPHTMTQVP